MDEPSPIFRFGVFEVDVKSGQLRRNGVGIKLQDQLFRLLVFLLKHPGEIVSRDRLQRELWPEGTYVSFANSLYIAIKKLRQALGDDSDAPRYIETIPKRGYRFIAAVNATDSSPPTAEGAETVAPPPLAPRVSKGTGVETAAPQGIPTSHKGYLLIIAIAVALTLAAGVAYFLVPRRHPQSLAVLPFRNLAYDAKEEYYADGITDQLITELAEAIPLRVISLSSVMKFKASAKSLPEIARELKADLVVEGSVERTEGQARITVQLLDGRKDQHLWGHTYKRTRADLLTLQDELVRDIGSEIASRLAFPARGQPAPKRPSSAEAYDNYLRGRYFWNRRTLDGLTRSISYFRQALQLDPTYAEAWAALGQAYSVETSYGSSNPAEALARAREATEKALSLDGRLAEAHTTLAAIHVARLEWDSATAEYQLAIKCNPSYPTARHWYSIHLARMGRFRDATAEIQLAVDLDPLSLIINTDAGESWYWARDPGRAEGFIRRALELDQNFAEAHMVLGKIYEQRKQFTEALTEFQSAEKLFGKGPAIVALEGHALALKGDRAAARTIANELETSDREPVSGVDLGIVYCALGDTDSGIRWLEKAWQRNDRGIDMLGAEPLFDGCRHDARFSDLLQRLKLR